MFTSTLNLTNLKYQYNKKKILSLNCLWFAISFVPCISCKNDSTPRKDPETSENGNTDPSQQLTQTKKNNNGENENTSNPPVNGKEPNETSLQLQETEKELNFWKNSFNNLSQLFTADKEYKDFLLKHSEDDVFKEKHVLEKFREFVNIRNTHIERLQNKNSELDGKYKILFTNFYNISEELENLKKQTPGSQSNNNAELTKSYETLETNFNKLKDNFDRIAEENTTLKAEKEALSLDKTNLNTEINILKAEIESITGNLDPEKTKVISDLIYAQTKLGQEKNELITKNAQLTEEKTKLEQEKNELTNEYSELSATKESLLGDNAEKELTNNNLIEENNKLNENNHSLHIATSKLETEKEELAKKAANLRRNSSAYKSALRKKDPKNILFKTNSVNNIVDDTEKYIEKLENENQVLSITIENLKTELKSSKHLTDLLVGRIDYYDKSILDILNSFEKNDGSKKMDNILDADSISFEDLQESIQALANKFEEASKKNKEFKAQFLDLKAKVFEMISTFNRKHNLSEFDKKEVFVKVNGELTNDDLERISLNDLTGSIETILASYERLSGDLEKKAKSYKTLDTKCKNLENEINNHNNQVKAKDKEIADLKERISKYEFTIASLKENLRKTNNVMVKILNIYNKNDEIKQVDKKAVAIAGEEELFKALDSHMKNLSDIFSKINAENENFQRMKKESLEKVNSVKNLLDTSMSFENSAEKEEDPKNVDFLNNEVLRLNVEILKFKELERLYTEFVDFFNTKNKALKVHFKDLRSATLNADIVKQLEPIIKKLGELTYNPIEYTK